MQIMVVDVGGTHVKILATGQETAREFASGPSLTAEKMVSEVLKAAKGWKYDVVSVGYPGPLLRGKPIAEPHNLGPGWVGFNFEAALGCPVKLINDAAMQALGSYAGGKMLFLGLGTGLGAAMIVDGIVEPMELGHLPYKRGTFEDYVGIRGLKRVGKKKWRHYVKDAVARLTAALEPDYVVLGGGNVRRLKELPPNCRAGDKRECFPRRVSLVGGDWRSERLCSSKLSVKTEGKTTIGCANCLRFTKVWAFFSRFAPGRTHFDMLGIALWTAHSPSLALRYGNCFIVLLVESGLRCAAAKDFLLWMET